MDKNAFYVGEKKSPVVKCVTAILFSLTQEEKIPLQEKETKRVICLIARNHAVYMPNIFHHLDTTHTFPNSHVTSSKTVQKFLHHLFASERKQK